MVCTYLILIEIWLDTPFLMQGFLVESLDDIDTVAEFCEHVWVDAVEEAWVPPEERGLVERPKRRSYINKLPVEQEQARALGTFPRGSAYHQVFDG